ncbi:hypothetical protein ACI48D_25670 [Massilia sp. LXY-6]|uniref:hypothetical protein n=1 Tax=Massilia sp. LXY-6 TaxID=3379823 RepID=UPI003EE1352C
MDNANNSTIAILKAVIMEHLDGGVAIGIDTGATGTGKTTSASEFLNNLDSFLEGLDSERRLKVVIVASQHRHLGNYWKRGSHQRLIRFLGAEEYARRLRELANQPLQPHEVEEHMVDEGLIPPHCPLRRDRDWQKEITATAERKLIKLSEFRDRCRERLRPQLQSAEPAQLFEACNHACPLAGGSFFGARLPHDPPANGQDRISRARRPRIALLTSAKLRYHAAAFYVHNGEVAVRHADFGDITDAVFLYEEAADVFETMLGYVDEKAVQTELLSTAALTHELFNRRQFEQEWIRHFYEQTSSIYLGTSADTIVQAGQWLPVNVYQSNPKEQGDYLLPVSRDRCALVMADFPRYVLHKQLRDDGTPYCFVLTITGPDWSTARFPPQIVRPSSKAVEAQSTTPSNVVSLTVPLGNLVRATFSRAIKPLVTYFHWAYKLHKYVPPIPFRDHVTVELSENFQLHSAVKQELRDLALSEIDFGNSMKTLRDKTQEIFAEDYYYKHGIAFCEVHRPTGDIAEREPLKITLNVSNPPPELLLYNQLKNRNSIIFSSATIRVKSPYTNINLDWVLRKFRAELALEHSGKHSVIDVDDPSRSELYRLKRNATNALYDARRWDKRPLEVEIFQVSKDRPGEDSEYQNGYQKLTDIILSWNKQGIPVIGIVLVNSYEHARELLRQLERSYQELNIGELCGINTDVLRPGLSILETWITEGKIQRSANSAPSPTRDSILFDEIECAVSSRMGPLLSRDEPMNGLIVSVIKKIGKGANFRNDLTNVKLGKCGRAYMGDDFHIDPRNPFVDFNLIAFAEHPRNFVNPLNYRRIAVQAVSIGGREMREQLSQQLRAGNVKAIQKLMKWSSFGSVAVLETTAQGAGRIVRCRSPLPLHRCVLISDTHARLVMLGMGCSDPRELPSTPDLARIGSKCIEYWIDSTLNYEDERSGAAEWVCDVYGGKIGETIAALKAVRDIRTFLAEPGHHLMAKEEFERTLARAFADDYGSSPTVRAVKETARDKLCQSYIAVTREQLAQASVAQNGNQFILHNEEKGLSVISYRAHRPRKKTNQDVIMLLKPRELYELAYPAADEAAIMTVLERLNGNMIELFKVQSALRHKHFMGPIWNGTHEAGDFYLKIRGINILLDAKTTAVRSSLNPQMRDVDSLRKEVSAKSARFSKGTGIAVDAFVFANSGWEFQKMWYPDELPGCDVPVFHMDACTTLSLEKMTVEFSRSLHEIATQIGQRKARVESG